MPRTRKAPKSEAMDTTEPAAATIADSEMETNTAPAAEAETAIQEETAEKEETVEEEATAEEEIPAEDDENTVLVEMHDEDETIPDNNAESGHENANSDHEDSGCEDGPPNKRQCIEKPDPTKESSDSFNPDFVNQKVTLKALKLKKDFVIIVSKYQTSLAKLSTMRRDSNFDIEFVKREPLPEGKPARQAAYINRIRVADGVGKSAQEAKKDAANNCLNFIVSKGVRLISPCEIEESQTMSLSFETIHKKGLDRQKVIDDFVQEEFLKFVLDPQLLRLFVTDVTFADLSKYNKEKSAIFTIASKFSMHAKLEGKGTGTLKRFCILKKTSGLHNIFVETEAESDENGDEKSEDVETEMEIEDIAEEDRLPIPLPSTAISKLDNEANLNKSMTLTAIKVDGFRGIYASKLSPANIIRLVAEACEVELEYNEHNPVTVTKKNEIRTTHKQTLYISKVAICDGSGKSPHNAHQKCASNALKYLKAKGLAIMSPKDVEESEILHISKEDLCENGEDLRMIEQCVEEKIDIFLKDETLLKILFSNDLDKYEREVVEKHSDNAKLSHSLGGTGHLVTWKSNNKIHTMAAPEIEEVEIEDVEEKEKAESQIEKVSKERITESGTDLRKIEGAVEEKIQEFLTNDDLTKLLFSSELDKYEKDIVEKLAKKWELNHAVEGSGESAVWKDDPALKTITKQESTPKRELGVKSKMVHKKPDKPNTGKHQNRATFDARNNIRSNIDRRAGITRTIDCNTYRNVGDGYQGGQQHRYMGNQVYRSTQEDQYQQRQRQQMEDYQRYQSYMQQQQKPPAQAYAGHAYSQDRNVFMNNSSAGNQAYRGGAVYGYSAQGQYGMGNKNYRDNKAKRGRW